MEHSPAWREAYRSWRKSEDRIRKLRNDVNAAAYVAELAKQGTAYSLYLDAKALLDAAYKEAEAAATVLREQDNKSPTYFTTMTARTFLDNLSKKDIMTAQGVTHYLTPRPFTPWRIETHTEMENAREMNGLGNYIIARCIPHACCYGCEIWINSYIDGCTPGRQEMLRMCLSIQYAEMITKN